MLVLRNMRCESIDSEGAVLNAIGISPYHWAKVCVDGLGVVEVLDSVMLAKDYILWIPVLVVDVEVI